MDNDCGSLQNRREIRTEESRRRLAHKNTFTEENETGFNLADESVCFARKQSRAMNGRSIQEEAAGLEARGHLLTVWKQISKTVLRSAGSGMGARFWRIKVVRLFWPGRIYLR